MVAIVNPLLLQAYETDMFYPYMPSSEVRTMPQYMRAVEQGWSEWIESDEDVEALRQGYEFDLSRDVHDQPCYWFDGTWQLADGTRIDPEDEVKWIGYVGKGDQMMRFAESFLFFTKEPHKGKPYRLMPWMRKICATLFGWTKARNADGHSRYRRYQHMYCAVSKKNAKSSMLAVIALYVMVGEGQNKAYCYGCASDRNQARIIYDEAMHLVKESPDLRDILTVIESRSRLVHLPTGSFYSVLSADAHRNDGIDSAFTAFDEIHQQRDRKLYTVMERAGIARPNPLMCVITTYGESLSDGSIWAEVHNRAKSQLEGRLPLAEVVRNYVFVASAEPIPVVINAPAKMGDTVLHTTRLQQPVDVGPMVFDLSDFTSMDGSENQVTVTVAEEAKRYQNYVEVEPLTRDLPAFSEATANMTWKTDHAIRRANPGVGEVDPVTGQLPMSCSLDMDTLRRQVALSTTPERESETMRFNFNIVSGGVRKWITAAAWSACAKWQVQPKKLIGRHCYGGIDLSFGNDLTAFVLAFPNWEPHVNVVDVTNPRIDLLTWCWVPDEQIEQKEKDDKMPYRFWARKDYLIDGMGSVRLCTGRVIDFSSVAADIKAITGHFGVRAIAYDPNMAQFLVPKLETESGLPLIPFRQGVVTMAPACKRFHEAVYKGWLAHGSHPMLDRAIESAELRVRDDVGNAALSKKHSKSRIDALIAGVMAVGYTCDPPVDASGAWADSSSGTWG